MSPHWVASHPDLPTLADGGYEGAGIGVHTPYKQPTGDQILHEDNRTDNALLRGLRCLGERGFAVLTGRWRTLHERWETAHGDLGAVSIPILASH